MKTVGQVPKFMGEGSEGPHVSLLHAFLAGQNLSDGLKYDAGFGKVTTINLKKFQKRNNLEEDGCFGPESRALTKNRFNFDFESACKTIVGETIFCDILHKEEKVIYQNKVI
jgi:hypothetical protein